MVYKQKKIDNTPSISEWMKKLRVNNVAKFELEDNTKFDRLEKLNKLIKIKYLKIKKIKIEYVIKKHLNKKFGNNKYTWRLIPKETTSPRIRAKDKTIIEGTKWLSQLNINTKKYKYIEIIPFVEKNTYSTIFVINDKGIWGEIIKGHVWQLAYGTHTQTPDLFYYNIKNKKLIISNKTHLKSIEKLIKQLRINTKLQKKLKQELDANFTPCGLLKGYFEAQIINNNILFNDYNREIYKILKKFQFKNIIEEEKSDKIILKGRCASKGKAVGKIKIVKKIGNQKFNKNDILVCKNITEQNLLKIKKVQAIISEQGNILSHAAIAIREIKKPYISNVKNALTKLKDGQLVSINADNGVIQIV